MILLKKIKLVNFLSHSNTEIEFKPDQKILISGKSGSGKSSIVDALIWCLFNKGRSDNRSLIKHKTTGSIVSVILEDDENNKTYRIERSINKSNKHELKIFEKEGDKKFSPTKIKGVKELQEYIEREILHSSYILFINSIIYPQENNESFVSQTALKKKDIILEIINSSGYDDYLKKAKAELQKIKTEKEVLLSKIEGENNSILNNENTANRLKEYEKLDIELEKEIETLKKEYQKYLKRQKEIDEQSTNIKISQEKLNMKLNEYNNEKDNLKKLNEKLIELSNIDITELKKKVELLDNKKKELDDYNNIKDQVIIWNEKFNKIISQKPAEKDYQSLIDEINKKLIEIIKEQPEECPKCGYIDPKWNENHQERIKYQEDTLNVTQGKFDAYNTLLKEYEESVKQLGEQPKLSLTPTEYYSLKEEVNKLEKLNKELLQLESDKEQSKEIEKEIKELMANQDKLQKEIEKIKSDIGENDLDKESSDIKNNIVKINGKIDELLMKHSNNKELLGIARHADKAIVNNKENLKKYKKDIKSNEENESYLELVKGAFGPNGIKAIVIDYLLPELEDRINNILSKLSDFRIELSTQKSGVGKDVILEGLYIEIINEVGERFDFSGYSGGEKSRISYAIFEALASLSKINFRILDEAFFALDTETATNFVSIVNLLQQNVSNVVCITHLDQIKELFPDKILIVKTNGNSKINI